MVRRILRMGMVMMTVLVGVGLGGAAMGQAGGGGEVKFGPANPFYAASELPYQAPPFDRIKDADYQPALEAGMMEQKREIAAIVANPAKPTFENTLVALEKSGQLYARVAQVFDGLTQANTNPALQKVDEEESPKRAAHDDSIFLNEALFKRVAAVYAQRERLKDAESRRLVEVYYKHFVHQGANLSEADKAKLKALNEEGSTLENSFRSKLLAATKAGAFATKDKAALAGLSDAELKAAQDAAAGREVEGYVLPLQNTTQQPVLASLSDRATREAVFQDSLGRAERGGENDTRRTILKLAKLRAEKAKLLGFANYAAWQLDDQMAKTPEAAVKFMDALVPASSAKAEDEAREIQKLIDRQSAGAKTGKYGNSGPEAGRNDELGRAGEFTLQPWDWEFHSEQVRKAKYDIDEEQVKPYFEIWNVLKNGVFYAAHELYGITFKERKDIPVYNSDVRVYEVFDTDKKPLALWYFDYFKRDNKAGGAWMSNFVGQSKLLGTLPVIYNVANFQKPAAGEPALISFTDVTTMFHEFGHGLHGTFADGVYPMLSGTSVPRDFVEFPSQFNEHWASYPAVFRHYAKHYKTGAAMPEELAAKIRKAEKFNQGYLLTELLAAAELDMQWHTIAPGTAIESTDAFEKAALERKKIAIAEVPPRYRSTYFAHIWSGGYAAGYYAYLWSEMLDDDAYQWFEDHGGMTRKNGDRFRRMVLAKGNTEELGKMYAAWLGAEPGTGPMLQDRGLAEGK
ncbi:MAG TPA: M3 family metallopeptidase [Acidobacteriaceae bacterium]|nr:M3 family metallopeptidase [Acidobacteriaceae bacterium]